MENPEYYNALAEKIFFLGVDRGEFSEFAKYRSGKKPEDLHGAIRSSGGLDGIGKFPSLAKRLHGVLEINTEAYDKKYGKPDPYYS